MHSIEMYTLCKFTLRTTSKKVRKLETKNLNFKKKYIYIDL